MRKRKQKKNNVHFIECNNNHISQEKMIEIHAEAYYKALKRIEDEKPERGEKIIEFMRMFLLCLFRVCWGDWFYPLVDWNIWSVVRDVSNTYNKNHS